MAGDPSGRKFHHTVRPDGRPAPIRWTTSRFMGRHSSQRVVLAIVASLLLVVACPASAKPKPDLTVANVSTAQATVAPGAKLSVRDVTKNRGGASAGASK